MVGVRAKNCGHTHTTALRATPATRPTLQSEPRHHRASLGLRFSCPKLEITVRHSGQGLGRDMCKGDDLMRKIKYISISVGSPSLKSSADAAFCVHPDRCASVAHGSLLLRPSHSASQSISIISEIASVVLENQGRIQ